MTHPKFGDNVTNTAAGDSNPRKHGLFVRVVRSTGKVNPGIWYECTDGKGDFWQTDSRSIVPTLPEQPETTMTITLQCRCGDRYPYLIVDTDNGAVVELDSQVMCVNCAMTAEQPDTCECSWVKGPISSTHNYVHPAIVHYRNDEDGGAGYGIACGSHDMAGVPFLQLTDGGDIPAKWVLRYFVLGGPDPITIKSGRE
jgi:hypothetical protein